MERPDTVRLLALNRYRAARHGLVLLTVVFASWSWADSIARFSIIAAAALVVTWLEYGSLRPLGIGRPRSWTATLVGGLVLAALSIVLVNFLLSPVLDWLLPMSLRASRDLSLAGVVPVRPAAAGLLVLLAAVAEEIIYRGFLLHQLSAAFGRSYAGHLAAIIIAALAFALPHFQQGVDGVLGVYIVGLLFGWVYFRSGRNLLLLMLAHASLDAWALACHQWYGGLP